MYVHGCPGMHAVRTDAEVEVAVKKILVGLPVNNQAALANPASLELYKNIPEIDKW